MHLLTDLQHRVYSVCFSADGKFIASGSRDKTVKIWSVGSSGTFECQSTLAGHNGYVPAPLALLIFKVVLFAHYPAMRSTVWSVGFDPSGKKLVSGSSDKTVRVWDATTGEPIGSPLAVDSGEYGVLSVSFSPKDNVIAAGCYNGKIHLVDAVAGEVKSTLTGHSDW